MHKLWNTTGFYNIGRIEFELNETVYEGHIQVDQTVEGKFLRWISRIVNKNMRVNFL